jgi:carbamoyltransferase
MNVLGLNLSHDASATLLKNGNIVACVQEERLNRNKFAYTFPEKAIAEVLKISGITAESIKEVAWTSVVPLTTIQMRFLLERNPYTSISDIPVRFLLGLFPRLVQHFFYCRSLSAKEENIQKANEMLANRLLSQFGITAPLRRHDHHMCHAASAYYTSGFKDAMVVTSDGAGDGLSGTITIARDGELKRVACVSEQDASLGFLYSEVTRALGYRPNRHEGKITGLAAYGNPNVAKPSFYQIIDTSEDGLQIKNQSKNCSSFWYLFTHPWYALKFIGTRIDHFRSLKHYHWVRKKVETMAKKYSAEDMAAGIQCFTEEVATHWVDSHATRIGEKTFGGNIALAGGLFANVRVNACIAELSWVTQLSVHPNMGDGGLALGAAYLSSAEKIKIKSVAISHVYLGPDYPKERIKKALDNAGLNYTYEDDIENLVAERLAENKIVARMDGRMEYGPRALGNRSILYATTDKTVNKWLNEKLNRTEFMPFAPVCLQEDGEAFFDKYERSAHASQFMTIAYNVSQEFARKCPAVVHIDGTARPQTVSEDHSPKLYKILKLYQKATGIPALLNTSFNMHEEPIVCSPEDAVKGFMDSKLDCLSIGNFFVERK